MPTARGNRARLCCCCRVDVSIDLRRQPVFRRRQNEETKKADPEPDKTARRRSHRSYTRSRCPALARVRLPAGSAAPERPASFIATSGNLVLNVIRFPSRFLQPAEKHLSAISRPIGIDDVAAGDGALQTCSMRPVFRNRKSCSRRPSRITAWALMPASIG